MDGEGMLAAARGVLGIPHLAETDDLFHAGMTSLAALKLADELGALLGRDIGVADIYHAATVERIRHLATGTEAAEDTPNEDVTVLSHAQRRFWLAERLVPGAADNMIVLAYLLTGPLKTDALCRALARLVERHPILRMRYPLRDGDIQPEVVPAADAVIVVEPVAPPPEVNQTGAVAESLTADWWDTPFKIDQELPIRARLCRIDAETHLFCVQIHHIAFDGRSERLFVDDLSALYRAELAADPKDAPPPLKATYAEYAGRERRAGNDPADLAFWEQALAAAPPPFLPTPPKPTAESFRRETVREIPAATVGRLHSVARHRRAPAVTTLTAATSRALAEVFGVSDMCLGAITEGRPRAVDNAVIGYFVNPLAVPLKGVRDLDHAGLLDHAASRLLDAVRHARIPFDELVRLLKPRRGRHPWFQTLVMLQYEPPGGEFAPGTTIRAVRVRQPRTAVEFMVEAVPRADKAWDLRMAWRADGCDEATAVAVTDHVVIALNRIAALACESIVGHESDQV